MIFNFKINLDLSNKCNGGKKIGGRTFLTVRRKEKSFPLC